jgi:predicted PurR-regulated permease PerM
MFGIMGMLLAVPVVAVLQVFLRSLTEWYRGTDFYLDEP